MYSIRMPSRRYDMVKLSNQLETLLKETGISCMVVPENDEIFLMDWIQGEKSLYKMDTVILSSDLTYTFAEFVQLPPDKEVDNGVSVVLETSKENQAKYVARQHTVYRLQQALSCLTLYPV